MDEAHLEAALRYVAFNPVRARLVGKVTEWRWSSVHAQLGLVGNDGLTDTGPVRSRYPDFAAFLLTGENEEMSSSLRRAETVGRPLGDGPFLDLLEEGMGRRLKPAKRGPKPQARV